MPRNEVIAPIFNKTGVFLTNERLRNIVGQQQTLSLQSVLDESKILIVNLSKGLIGEGSASILGSMVISSIQFAALARARFNASERKPFFMYIDEAHSFLTLALVDVLARRVSMASLYSLPINTCSSWMRKYSLVYLGTSEQ